MLVTSVEIEHLGGGGKYIAAALDDVKAYLPAKETSMIS